MHSESGNHLWSRLFSRTHFFPLLLLTDFVGNSFGSTPEALTDHCVKNPMQAVFSQTIVQKCSTCRTSSLCNSTVLVYWCAFIECSLVIQQPSPFSVVFFPWEVLLFSFIYSMLIFSCCEFSLIWFRKLVPCFLVTFCSSW